MMYLANFWNWLNENSSALNLFINIGLLVVWGTYLHLFVLGYRRGRRSRILITSGGPNNLNARCLISNMSAEPIYIIRLRAMVVAGEERWCHSITEYRLNEDDVQPTRPEQHTRQGPLLKGHWRDVGSFRDLLLRAREKAVGEDPMMDIGNGERPAAMELTVVAIYSSEEIPVGAVRSFNLTPDGGDWCVRPATSDTEQIRHRRARRRLHEV